MTDEEGKLEGTLCAVTIGVVYLAVKGGEGN
jgi:hypothetical protein